jgi:aspartyl-tRNA(Asn)/glutamyl-tRNA(Gln) amidotransferase subunit C
MVEKEIVKHIANLSKISLTEKEISFFQKELSIILDYIEKIKSKNLEKVDPTISLAPIKNVFREDKKEEIHTLSLLDSFLEKKERFLKIPSVFNEN